jgi:hypothetical protein
MMWCGRKLVATPLRNDVSAPRTAHYSGRAPEVPQTLYKRMSHALRFSSARGFFAYVAVYWGVRVALQAVFELKEHLTTWWLKFGYMLLGHTFCLAHNRVRLGCASLWHDGTQMRPQPRYDSELILAGCNRIWRQHKNKST